MSQQQGDLSNVVLVPQADEDEDDDNDSALGLNMDEMSTASIGSSILRYRQENGRSYHAYKEGTYVLPNDEEENDRLDLQHHLFTLTFGGKLFTRPIDKAKNLHRVLDVGTGTGIWAIDFADGHPEAQVFGVDLSPIQPSLIPPNLEFYVDDVEEEWTFSSKFDFIHTRMMTGSISKWPEYFRRSFENLNPGGYIELADIVFPIQTDDATLPADSALRKWTDLMLEASKVLQRPLDSAKSYSSLLATAGFTDIVETHYKWPQNRWPKDPKHKELGMWNYENIGAGLSGLSMALFTRGLNWSAEEVEIFLVDVRKDMRKLRIHAYWPIYVVSAMKPL